MFENSLKLLLFLLLLAFGQSGVRRNFRESIQPIEDTEEVFEDSYGVPEGESEDIPEENDKSKRPTNVLIREYYNDCVNINSEVEKLSVNLSVVSNESCLTLYRFAAFEIVYDVLFKNGASAQTKVLLDLQDSQRMADTITVTLTGKVIEGYLIGAHFQSVIIYPVMNYSSKCLTEPGVTQLQSNSASVTFILLPKNADSEQIDSVQSGRTSLPEAFDCFGNASIDYYPGLLKFNNH